MKNSRPIPIGLAGLFVVAGFFLAIPPANAAEEIEYAYPDVSVWTTKRDASGKLKNPLVCIADYIFKQADIPWHPADYPAARLFKNLRTGASNFSILVNASAALKGCCLLSKKPVAAVDLRVFRKRNSPPITSRIDLNGKRIIAIHGYSYGGIAKYVKDPVNLVQLNEARNHESAFAMLEAGRGDYVIDYAEPARETLAISGIKNVASESISRKDVFLVLNKNYPNARQVMKKLEKAAASIPSAKQAACWKQITEED